MDCSLGQAPREPWADSKKAQLLDLPAGPHRPGFNAMGGPGEGGSPKWASSGSLAISFVCQGSQAQEVFVEGMGIFNAELRFLSLPVYGIWVSLNFLCFTHHIHFSSQPLQGIPGGQRKILYEDAHSAGGRVAGALCLLLSSPKSRRGAQLWGAPRRCVPVIPTRGSLKAAGIAGAAPLARGP